MISYKTLLCHGALRGGQELLYAIQSVSIVPILRHLGMDNFSTSFVWIGPPILGLILGPLLGHEGRVQLMKDGTTI